jgi:hypothetical protein
VDPRECLRGFCGFRGSATGGYVGSGGVKTRASYDYAWATDRVVSLLVPGGSMMAERWRRGFCISWYVHVAFGPRKKKKKKFEFRALFLGLHF